MTPTVLDDRYPEFGGRRHGMSNPACGSRNGQIAPPELRAMARISCAYALGGGVGMHDYGFIECKKYIFHR